MQAKGSGGSSAASYALGHARGTVVVNGVSYVFLHHRGAQAVRALPVDRQRARRQHQGGLDRAQPTARNISSLNPDVNAANQVSQAAPKLDLSTLTADDGGTTITATPIDGETGNGF